MRTIIFLDNNVWDFLFERALDLTIELPPDEFCIRLVGEIAQFEIPPISNPRLKEFIHATIKDHGIKVRRRFGFHDASLPDNEQRVGGFDEGEWTSAKEIAFIKQQAATLGKAKRLKTRLYPNEADISLAALAFENVVLTCDKKPGPLKTAYEQGGKVVFLQNFDESGLSLRDYVTSKN